MMRALAVGLCLGACALAVGATSNAKSGKAPNDTVAGTPYGSPLEGWPEETLPQPSELEPFWNATPDIKVDKNVGGSDIVWYAGHFVGDSARRLREALDENNVGPGATIMFSSPGGDADQAVVMGRMIRQRSLRTSVGTRPRGGPTMTRIADPTYCISACSIAFLGGVIRTVPNPSLYVIHTITLVQQTPGKPTPDHQTGLPYFDKGIGLGEHDASEEIAYLQDMGIDLGWYVEASNWDTEHDVMYVVSNDQLRKWHVVTDVPDTKWEIRPRGGSFHLVAKSPGFATPESQDELSFSCAGPGALQMAVFYIPAKPGLADRLAGYALAAPLPHAAGNASVPSLLKIPDSALVTPFRPVTDKAAAPITGVFAVGEGAMAMLKDANDLSFQLYTDDGAYQGFDVDMSARRDLFNSFVETCGSKS